MSVRAMSGQSEDIPRLGQIKKRGINTTCYKLRINENNKDRSSSCLDLFVYDMESN